GGEEGQQARARLSARSQVPAQRAAPLLQPRRRVGSAVLPGKLHGRLEGHSRRDCLAAPGGTAEEGQAYGPAAAWAVTDGQALAERPSAARNGRVAGRLPPAPCLDRVGGRQGTPVAARGDGP